ncbi:hypothetical protein ACHAW6_011473 [Cyclotella cf. meneghiniana]
MKSLLLAISTGVTRVRGSSALDGLNTGDLQASTKDFVESYKGAITPYSRRKLQEGYSTTVEQWGGGTDVRGGKGGKGGIAGKSSKNSEWNNDDAIEFEPDQDMFHLLPVACPGYCVSSYTNRNFEMVNSLSRCSGSSDMSQWWKVHSDGSYVMVESYETGLCISVDFVFGDTPAMLTEACNNGIVTLRACSADYGTQWYFTGGQLVNSLCWGAGISSALTVFPDPDRDGDCDGAVSVYGSPYDPILRADTFMFVNRLPQAPFDVDDIFSS